MGLTISRKTAKNLAVRGKNERILFISRKKIWSRDLLLSLVCYAFMYTCSGSLRGRPLKGRETAKIRSAEVLGGEKVPYSVQSSRVQPSRASRARLSHFPSFRTPATQAMFW